MDDFTLIRKALSELPAQCRYHADTEPHPGPYPREACCDTGVPAQRRKLAEQALHRLQSEAVRQSEPTAVLLDPRVLSVDDVDALLADVHERGVEAAAATVGATVGSLHHAPAPPQD